LKAPEKPIEFTAELDGEALGTLLATPKVSGVDLVTQKKIEPKIGMYARVKADTDPGNYKKDEIIRIKSIEDRAIPKTRVLFCKNHFHGVYLDEVELLPCHKPMRHWTDEEITEAKCIIAELMFEVTLTVKNKGINNFQAGDQLKTVFKGETYTATCCPTDEWNFWIGRMVSLCKAHGRKLPKWMYSD
jgi:hypothetical protein